MLECPWPSSSSSTPLSYYVASSSSFPSSASFVVTVVVAVVVVLIVVIAAIIVVAVNGHPRHRQRRRRSRCRHRRCDCRIIIDWWISTQRWKSARDMKMQMSKQSSTIALGLNSLEDLRGYFSKSFALQGWQRCVVVASVDLVVVITFSRRYSAPLLQLL